jgi:integrase
VRNLLQLRGQAFPCLSCGQTHPGIAFGAPKTASGEARRVDLGARGVGALLAQQLNQDEDRAAWGSMYVEHGLVFAREDGLPLAPEQVTRTFAQLVKSAGVRPLRLHDLRHGRASMLLATGVDIALVSKMMGHSTLTITTDTYAHLLGGVGRQAADAADALVPQSRSPVQSRDLSSSVTCQVP